MSYGPFPANDPNAVKIWAKNVEVAEREFAEIAPLIGKGPTAVIQLKSELENGPGDNIKFTLRSVLQGDGFTEGQRAEGNGEALTFSQDNITINELGNVVGCPSNNTIDAQRIPLELRSEARDGLGEWWAERKSSSIFRHLCGFTPANALGVKFIGHNTVTAPTGTTGHIRQMWAGTATNDQGLGTNDTFTTALIDKAVTRARMGIQKIPAIKVGGASKYVMYLSDVQVEQLRTNAGAGGWLDIQKAALMGAGKHGIYDGSLGEWNGVVLRRGSNVTYGVDSGTGATVTNVRRAVLLGRQAAVVAHGRKTMPAKGNYRWSEKLLDHDRLLEVGAWGIWGCKKAVFQVPINGVMSSLDFGCLVVSTWAPDPT